MNYIVAYPLSAGLYLLVLIICCVFAQAAKHNKDRSCAAATAVVLILFVGLRSIGVGLDTSLFFTHFNSVLVFGVEEGFLLLMRFIAHLGGSFNLVLLICAAVTYSLFVFRLWELRDSLDFTVGVFVLYCLYLPYSMNTFRQFVVLAIVFWASRYFFKQQYLKYAAITLACVVVHKSAVIGLGLFLYMPFLLKHLSGNKRTIGLLLSLCLPAVPFIAYSLLFGESQFSSYSRYLENSTSGNAGLMALFKLLFIASIFIVCGRERLFSEILPDTTTRCIAAASIAGIALEPLNTLSPYLDRAALYYSIYQVAFFAVVYKNVDKKTKLYVLAGVGAMCFYTLLTSIYSNGQGTMPYSMISIFDLFSW